MWERNIFIIILLFGFILSYLLYKLLIGQKRLIKLIPKNDKGQKNKKSSAKQDATLTLKVQAYERLLLLLERMQPSVLIKRNFDISLSIAQFQLKILQNIREEFEHNLAQQLYISENTWAMIKTSREELVQKINMCVGQLPEGADTTYLAQLLIDIEIPNIDQAISLLKTEFKEI